VWLFTACFYCAALEMSSSSAAAPSLPDPAPAKDGAGAGSASPGSSGTGSTSAGASAAGASAAGADEAAAAGSDAGGGADAAPYYWEVPGVQPDPVTLVTHNLHWLTFQLLTGVEYVGEVFSDMFSLVNSRYAWAVEADRNRVVSSGPRRRAAAAHCQGATGVLRATARVGGWPAAAAYDDATRPRAARSAAGGARGGGAPARTGRKVGAHRENERGRRRSSCQRWGERRRSSGLRRRARWPHGDDKRRRRRHRLHRQHSRLCGLSACTGGPWAVGASAVRFEPLRVGLLACARPKL